MITTVAQGFSSLLRCTLALFHLEISKRYLLKVKILHVSLVFDMSDALC